MKSKGTLQTIKNQTNMIFKSSFLSEFTITERYEFLQLCHRRKYKMDEYIFYQNDPGTGMYFIEEGEVQLRVVNNQKDPEADQIMYDLTAPDDFGSMSIGYDLRRMSSACCLTDCTLLGFFKPDFVTLKKRHPETAVKFLEAISSVAMKQLELTMRKLCEVTDTKTAFQIQFETHYGNKKSTQPD